MSNNMETVSYLDKCRLIGLRAEKEALWTCINNIVPCQTTSDQVRPLYLRVWEIEDELVGKGGEPEKYKHEYKWTDLYSRWKNVPDGVMCEFSSQEFSIADCLGLTSCQLWPTGPSIEREG